MNYEYVFELISVSHDIMNIGAKVRHEVSAMLWYV